MCTDDSFTIRCVSMHVENRWGEFSLKPLFYRPDLRIHLIPLLFICPFPLKNMPQAVIKVFLPK